MRLFLLTMLTLLLAGCADGCGSTDDTASAPKQRLDGVRDRAADATKKLNERVRAADEAGR